MYKLELTKEEIAMFLSMCMTHMLTMASDEELKKDESVGNAFWALMRKAYEATWENDEQKEEK